MIVRDLKPDAEICEILKPYKRVVIIGCAGCYGEGGATNVENVAKSIGAKGINVVAQGITPRQCAWILRCHEKGLKNKSEADIVMELAQSAGKGLRKEEVEKADALLSMACGVGAQTIAELAPSKAVIPAFNTKFMGRKEPQYFYEQCVGCGECIIHKTEGICPVTKCPKSDMNGPCGGVHNGKCEVYRDNDCVWMLIYEKLKSSGNLKQLRMRSAPKDFSLRVHPRKLGVK